MMRNAAFLLTILTALLSSLAAPPAAAQPANPPAAPVAAQPPAAPPARQATPILPLDQVRIGMKGYGMSVFHGAKIEPFAVEVISVMRDFAPQRGVVWIRCTDERMQKSGPVSGMSGSPIYLWDKDEPQEQGKGGKLIGAFAFGFSWTKDCYAGVQPIEMMRQTGWRIDEDKPAAGGGAAKPAARSHTSWALVDLARAAKAQKLDDEMTWRAAAMAKVVGVPWDKIASSDADAIDVEGPAELQGRPVRMMLPMAVGTASMAKTLRPMLAPMGIIPVETPVGTSVGLPPPGIDAKELKLQPGSVLSIPLAFGDADMSASGTVTDVLPNGRVLAFGHPMFGQGEVAMPMATGYVHFVVPRIPGAFKLGGSGAIQGTLLRDDAAAVAGDPVVKFTAAPVTVHVNFNGRKKTYNYKVAHHERLMPALVSAVVMQSVTADQSLPMENTFRLRGAAVFAGNRRVELSSIMAPGIDQRIMLDMVPALGAMVQNPYETMMLESLEVSIDVSPRIDAVSLIGVRVDRSEFEPGDEVKINLSIQPYGKDRASKTIAMKLPESLPEGKYAVTVGDGRTLARMIMQSRPHLLMAASANEVHAAVQTLMSVRQDAVYVVMPLPLSTGIALGRQELPALPSSRRLLIASAQNTVALPVADWVQETVPMDAMISGEVMFEIDVVKTGKKP